jgi:hypothetical protein
MSNKVNAPLVFVDIETIPDQTEGALERAALRVKVPANYSKPDTIDKFRIENTEREWLRTSLDPNYGHIVAIGVAIGSDGPVKVFAPGTISSEDDAANFNFAAFERKLLSHFWTHVSANVNVMPMLVGHYVSTFDIPFLMKRSVITRVYPSFPLDLNPRPWAPDVFDTRIEWTGDRNTHIKLDELARVLRIDMDKHNGHDGSDVWELVRSGNIRELGQYCKRDVELARYIYHVIRREWLKGE